MLELKCSFWSNLKINNVDQQVQIEMLVEAIDQKMRDDGGLAAARQGGLVNQQFISSWTCF